MSITDQLPLTDDELMRMRLGQQVDRQFQEIVNRQLEPELRTRELDSELERLQRRQDAVEARTEAERQNALFGLGPQATEEEFSQFRREAPERAQQEVEEASRAIRRTGFLTAPFETDLFRSDLVKGTGGLVTDKEAEGGLRQADTLEVFMQALQRQRLAEAGSRAERIRQVREGELTQQEAGIVELNLDRPLTEAGIEEDFFDMGVGVAMATEPFIGESLFGRQPFLTKGDEEQELLFFAVDRDGNPYDPDSFPVKAEQFLKKVAPEYAAQGRLLPFDLPLIAQVPRPFQATERDRGLMAASRRGDYLIRVADQIAERRSLGDEFMSLPLYKRDIEEAYGEGETILGMHPAYAAGTAASLFVPLPTSVIAKGVRGVAKAGSVALDVLGAPAIIDRLATSAAARKALGVDVKGVLDPTATPTLRTQAVRAATSPATSALEMTAVAREALDAGGTVNMADMGRRFGGDAAAAAMLDQASRVTNSAMRSAGQINPRRLEEVAQAHIRAPDYAQVLRRLKTNDLDASAAVDILSDMVPSGTVARLRSLGSEDIQRYLARRLRAVGHTPNTKNTFINGMYAMGSDLSMMLRAGVSAPVIASRAVKAMGTSGRLFQDNLMRTLLEEASTAGKDVARLIGAQARKAPSEARLKTMLDALGDGRGGVAVARAFRQTMETVARDRILQHLPDDYAFVSPRFMAKVDGAKSFENTKRAMARMAKELYVIEGTRGTDQVVSAVGSNSMDDIIKMFVSEIGPGALGAGEGFAIARSIVRKLGDNQALNPQEAGLFRDAMADAMARRVTGLEEAVTEGAQTALARNLAALRNSLYRDAYSGAAVGRAARGSKRTLAALSELIPLYKEASQGNAAASIIVSPDVERGLSKQAIDVFHRWYTKLVGEPMIESAFFGYKPESSVISETYARRIGDSVGTAADRMKSRYAELVLEGLKGEAVITRVLDDMGAEFKTLADEQFGRSLNAALDARAADIGIPVSALGRKDVVNEALVTAGFMVSKVTRVTVDGAFRAGLGPIDTALKRMGVAKGIDGLDDLSKAEGVEAVLTATKNVLAEQKNSDDWLSLAKTLIPGKADQNFIIEGVGTTPLQMTLLEAVDIVAKSPDKFGVNVRNGLLVPDIEGTKAVFELLADANGPDFLKSTLQYSGVVSIVKKGLGMTNFAWTEGIQVWLVRQRAGLDANRIFDELVDVAPEQALSLVPSNPNAAKDLQESAALSVINRFRQMEEAITGKPTSEAVYRDAYLEAKDFIAYGEPSGIVMSDLAEAMYRTMKFMQTIDFSLSAENRVQLASSLMSRSASGRGTVPDMGSVADRIVGDFTGYKDTMVQALESGQQASLKSHVGQLLSKYEINLPFFRYLEEASKSSSEPFMVRKFDLVGNITDSVYLGLIGATDESLLGPTYRAFESLWRRAGLKLDAGFIPGLDTAVISPQAIRPDLGPARIMAQGLNVQMAASQLQAAVASGRIQTRLEELSVRALNNDKIVPVALTAIKQLLQTMTRTARSTLLAGGGPLAVGPNVLYHTGNIGSVPEILLGTLGAEMAAKVLEQVPRGLASAARESSSIVFRNTVGRALAPITDVNEVVIQHPFLGNITAGELDKMMDAANIKFSRASIEAYESIADQMIEAGKIGLGKMPRAQQALRVFNPAGMHEWMKFAEDTDSVTRRATFIAALVDGQTVEQAAMLARESLLDYGKVATSDNSASRFAQRWTLFWAFRRQSLIMTINSLADGKFGRQELMGRWLRLQAEQKKGASPEEYLFGPEYTKLRTFWTPNADEFGFNAGFPSVMSEGCADLLGFMATFGTFVSAVKGVATGDEDSASSRDAYMMIVDLIARENFTPGTAAAAKAIQMLGRADDRGPLVSDVLMAQALMMDQTIGTNIVPSMIQSMNLVADRDPETGEPIVTRSRPFLQAEGGDLLQPPHQLRFKTNGDYHKYLAFRLAMTYAGSGRTFDEWTKIALTIEQLVPEGYKPEYRAFAGTVSYMMRTQTPMRVPSRRDSRVQIQKLQERQVQRARK